LNRDSCFKKREY
jgi:hypothetical protein